MSAVWSNSTSPAGPQQITPNICRLQSHSQGIQYRCPSATSVPTKHDGRIGRNPLHAVAGRLEANRAVATSAEEDAVRAARRARAGSSGDVVAGQHLPAERVQLVRVAVEPTRADEIHAVVADQHVRVSRGLIGPQMVAVGG